VGNLSNAGITFTNAYATSRVFAPSCKTIITGMLQTQTGTIQVRICEDMFSCGNSVHYDFKKTTALKTRNFII
jgi:arylsulfatase A-like enzyme